MTINLVSIAVRKLGRAWRPALLALLLAAFSSSSFANGAQDCFASCVAGDTTQTLVQVPQTQSVCMDRCNLNNIDYRCLNLCTAQGMNWHVCRLQCTYVKDDILTPPGAPRSTPHSQFTTLFQSDPSIVIPSPHTSPTTTGTPTNKLSPTTQALSPSTNYRCVSQCVQNGLMFSYCKQACTY